MQNSMILKGNNSDHGKNVCYNSDNTKQVCLSKNAPNKTYGLSTLSSIV